MHLVAWKRKIAGETKRDQTFQMLAPHQRTRSRVQ